MKEYYSQIVAITEDYLGPAAGRFVARQITSHLKKQPEQLEKKDIPVLAMWVRSGLMVLTHNQQAVDKAFHRISAIADY